MPQVRSCTADFEVGAREQGVTGRNIPEPLGASHHVKSAAQFAAHQRNLDRKSTLGYCDKSLKLLRK